MYQQQLNQKIEYFTQLFSSSNFNIPHFEVFESEPLNYRMRSEFRIWHENQTINYAMFESGQKASIASVIKLAEFPAASKDINQLMPKLMNYVNNNPVLKQKWYQCEFLNTLSGEMLVTMIYHKLLDEVWQNEALKLQEELKIAIIGRSRGQKIVLKQDFVTELLKVHEHQFMYRQIEGGFTQPNAKVCEKMLTWAYDCAEKLEGDLLELYCGNGNFTLPLSKCFNRVLATEVSKVSVAAAQWSIVANQADNIQIVRLSAQDFTTAYHGQREFRRLQEHKIDLKSYRFSTVFVDPPRAGIDEETLKLVAEFDNIIYISCNPITLHENLIKLSKTHIIKRMALFDQFPFTNHIESGVLLQRR